MRIFLKGLAVLALLYSTTSPAASWYQVELILFEYLQPDFDGELWYENPGLPVREDSIQLILDSGDHPVEAVDTREQEETLMPYLSLGKDYFRLDGVERVLRLSRDYNPLLHISWQQPALGVRQTRSVHLESTLFDTQDDQLRGSTDEIILAVPEIVYDGLVRLRSAHFIHVDVDFSYFPDTDILSRQSDKNVPQSDALFNLQVADYVRLTESRRIKLNEIHYFDHPLFGIILQVSRLRKPVLDADVPVAQGD